MKELFIKLHQFEGLLMKNLLFRTIVGRICGLKKNTLFSTMYLPLFYNIQNTVEVQDKLLDIIEDYKTPK